jgi:hypothetical protein
MTSTDIELRHSDEAPIYHRLAGEPLEAYEAFTEWCKIPMSSRNIGNFLRRTAYPAKQIRKLMKEWHWEVRANAFDHDSLQLRPDPSSMDEEAAIAGQMAAATALMELGLSALDLKDPSRIPLDKAIRLAEKGVEIQRRALGMADLNIQFEVADLSRVNAILAELSDDDDLVIEDAQIVPEPSFTQQTNDYEFVQEDGDGEA